MTTDKNKIINGLKKIENLTVNLNVPLKNYTTMQVGGPADIFLIPDKISALQRALSTIGNYNIPLVVLGRGSNIIAADSGFRGIIVYTGQLNKTRITKSIIEAEAGVKLSHLTEKALNAELSGLEFAAGIPGTIGGALYMNAGAYGTEMSDIVVETLLLDSDGQYLKLDNNQLNFSYRHSILQEKQLTAARILLRLKPGNRNEIAARMKKLKKKRNRKQPLQWASAGSAFKRPSGNYAGHLIEKAGLKGTRIGDACVSEKHAGFIINRGNASARDLQKLFKLVQKKVDETSGVKLEPEPKFIGDF
ncbi:MAG: UDP-N-acetylmuramate dehydrogenase [Halanaerobiales bacterium]